MFLLLPFSKRPYGRFKGLCGKDSGGREGFTLDQWKEANERFQKLLDKINSYEDLTKEELEEMAKLQGQYAATVFKNSGKSIMEQMQKAGVALDSLEEGFEKGMIESQELE